jgi:hypothetical protein
MTDDELCDDIGRRLRKILQSALPSLCLTYQVEEIEFLRPGRDREDRTVPGGTLRTVSVRGAGHRDQCYQDRSLPGFQFGGPSREGKEKRIGDQLSPGFFTRFSTSGGSPAAEDGDNHSRTAQPPQLISL